jgi:sortase A
MKASQLPLRLMSWLLLAGGVFFLVSGARDLLISVIGQREASKQWQSQTPAGPVRPGFEQNDAAICMLLIPRLHAHLFVVEGTNERDLRIGPGHMSGSALPGTSGNCIIAGHRDTHFRMLKDLRKGDDIILQTRTGEFHYQVMHTIVVPPTDNQPLQPTSNAVLNLITCYPFYYVGPAPKRFVVEAQLEQTPSATHAATAIVHSGAS